MFESHYGFTAPPFQLSPDPSFYFASKGHGQALSYLKYGVYQREGFIVVTGEIGSGKTTLVRRLLEGLDAADVVAAQVVNTQLDTSELLHAISMAFGVPVATPSKAQMLGRLEELGGTSNIPVIIVAIFVIFVGIVLAAVALPAYQQYTVKAKMSEAVLVGGDVTAAVGRSYEQTGQLPTDIDDLLAQATHHSAYVKGAALDGASGKVTLRVEAAPNIVGSLDFTPSADNHHHLSWTCSTDDLKRYAPPSCRQ